MTTFKLDPRHEQDSIFIADIQISQLRLFNRQELLWLILIPKLTDITEFYQLNLQQQHQVLSEINQVSHLLKRHFRCDKLNIAMLGNLVSQLHIHMIVRTHDDSFWPGPPFGLAMQAYAPQAAEDLVKQIRSYL